MDEMRARIICSHMYGKGTAGMSSRGGAAVDVLPSGILGKRYLNRATKIALLASSRLPLPVVPEGLCEDDVGLCVATFGAHFEPGMNQYTEIAGNEKPLISPMLGPNNTPNAIASQLAIYHKTKAFAVSFCDSGTAGMEALVFGSQAIRYGRAKRVLVIGAESRSEGLEKKMYGGEHPDSVDNAVAILLAEETSDNEHNGNDCTRFVRSGRSFIDPGDPEVCYQGISRCLNQALNRGNGTKIAPDAVFLGAPDPLREMELRAIRDIIGRDTSLCCLPPDPRSKLMRSIAALFKVHDAMKLLNECRLPETVISPGNGIPGAEKKLQTILINNFDHDGAMGCMLISKRKE